MSKGPLDEPEELYAVNFSVIEKPLLRIVMMQYFFIAMEDDTKDERMKGYIGEAGSIISRAVANAAPYEPVLLPYEGLALLYHSLAAGANILFTTNVKNVLKRILELDNRKAEPEDVKVFYEEAKLMSQHQIQEIKKRYGHLPDVKRFISISEETWRGVAKNRLTDKNFKDLLQ